jgi:uncharacterized protein YdhG (YjbR/CyaY superfamily)
MEEQPVATVAAVRAFADDLQRLTRCRFDCRDSPPITAHLRVRRTLNAVAEIEPVSRTLSSSFAASRAAFTPLLPVLAYGMSEQEVDNYLASLDEPKRSTLEALRRTILDVIPEAAQCISYGVPAFRLQGKVIAGFAAFKNHLSYLPHSGSIFPELGDAISQYTTSKGALQFAVDRPLPKALIKKLVAIRMRQALGP